MQLAKLNLPYLPAFTGLGLLLLAMLAACTAPSAVAVPTAEPTPLTISTELSQCVTLIAFLASDHSHKGGFVSDSPYAYSDPNTSSSSAINGSSAEWLFDQYCGGYIDSQLLEKFYARDWDAPVSRPRRFGE